MKIDAHNHFWKYDPISHAWIDDSMSLLRRDFLPDEFTQILKENGIDGTVAVQADQSESETEFLLQLAEDNDLIRGVVGWLDLRSANLEERLNAFSNRKKLKGLRHIVQAEPDPKFMLTADFQQGLSKLDKFGLTYDILVFPTQLEATIETVRNFPNQPFVLDHLAKPYIKDGKINQWKANIQQLAASENTVCKLSGMVTEADWKNWKQSDFSPYLDVVVEAFGTHRLMFGSDWPVCKVAAAYEQVLDIVESYFADFSSLEKAQIFGGNAIHFYNLKEANNE